MTLETAVEITADSADEADSRICERHTRSAELTHWVSARNAARACPSASIREIRGSISEFGMSRVAARHCVQFARL
jgi:hypothetical protein